MNTFTETVRVPLHVFDRVNGLLAETTDKMSMQELSVINARAKQTEGIFTVAFKDKSAMQFNLRHERETYFDDVIWTSPDRSERICFEPEFELDGIDFFANDARYIVHLDTY